MRRRLSTTVLAAGLLAAAALLAACGERSISVPTTQPVERQGAEVFYQRCAGCHTLTPAAANGSAANVRTRLRTNGPNFDQRKETRTRVLFAIENGGFSGAIMPQNIVTGPEAQAVASFVAQYAGQDVNTPPGPTPPAGPVAGTTTTTAKPSKAALVAQGKALYVSAGCGACHALADAGAKGGVGPTLQGVGTDPAAALKTSIVKPNAEIAKGYQPNVMPQTFGTSLTPAQVDALVAYLQAVAK